MDERPLLFIVEDDEPLRKLALYTWPKFREDAPANPHFTFLHSDAPLLPYDTELNGAAEHP